MRSGARLPIRPQGEAIGTLKKGFILGATRSGSYNDPVPPAAIHVEMLHWGIRVRITTSVYV